MDGVQSSESDRAFQGGQGFSLVQEPQVSSEGTFEVSPIQEVSSVQEPQVSSEDTCEVTSHVQNPVSDSDHHSQSGGNDEGNQEATNHGKLRQALFPSLAPYTLQPNRLQKEARRVTEQFTRNQKLENMGASESVPQKSIHEFTVKDYKNQDVDLSIYKGKVLLVVNVASKCGLTDSNYTQLTDLYNKYKDQGSSQEAQEFACTRYKAEYPIFQKVHVNGPKTEPVYNFLKSNTSGFLGSRIKWNFTKFLVDKDGSLWP
ncbi:hypothetical protein V6N12_053978 [Hibiscus sabdariffa]|uniref:Glutathione peroxidase n=1 Tax=Hibiscus sabdariffa TaxID=183260 RepID=A0ABR2DA31_9ROSI